MSKQSNESRALLIGFLLVIGIIVFSLWRYRSVDEPNKKELVNMQPETLIVNTLSSEELKTRLRTLGEKKTLLLDMRPSENFGQEHIIGSVNVTANSLASELPQNPPEDFLIVILNTIAADPVTRQTVKNLMQQDVPVSMLEGGFEAWKQGFGPTISWGNPQSIVDISKVHTIDTDKTKALFDNTEHAIPTIFIDTRSPDQFKVGHIPGALNIPLKDIESRRTDIPKGKTIIVYNDEAIAGFQSAVRLFDLNFPVQVLDGGWNAWKEKQYPIEK